MSPRAADAVLLPFATVAVGLLGLLIGSFLNVVVWRLPRGESLSTPSSHCPKCDHSIRWFDNIPVLSWLVLRGRCRDCGAPISPRYPLVELSTGVAFAAVALWSIGGTVDSWMSSGATVAALLAFAAFLYLASISIALTLIDLDVHRLPDSLVLPSYVVAAALLSAASLLTGDLAALARAGIGLAALFLAYLIMALMYPGGMGYGDVKLAGLLGLYLGWLGWPQLIVGAFAAFLLGGLFAILLLLTRRAGRRSGIPFGPWMIAGAWVGIFFGDGIAEWYLGLFGLGLG
jgi:leader peptidase (prepilin peptidase)/N-methyltransferase